MKRFNLNDMAREITLAEGGKVSLPIGQVKEVMRLTFERLAEVWQKEGLIGLGEILGRYAYATCAFCQRRGKAVINPSLVDPGRPAVGHISKSR